MADLFSLQGRKAVVTGAGSGFGRAFSKSLARAGAAVVAVDIDQAACQQTVAIITEDGGQADPYVVDVSDADSVNSLAHALETQYGEINVLVNNAGISQPSRVMHEIPVQEWDQVVAVNLRGPFLCSKAILPLMFGADGASVINISSVSGLRGVDPKILSEAAYTASKAGVIGLTLQMAADYGSRGIRVNAIAPGSHVGTNLGARVGNYQESDAKKQLLSLVANRTPLGRAGSAEELVGLMLYLASDASSYMTGQVIAHDGGWTAW